MYQFLPLTSLKKFDDWAGCEFNAVKLDFFVADKTITSGAVIQCLRHINDVLIQILSETLTPFCLRKKLKCLWTGLKTLRNEPFKVAY